MNLKRNMVIYFLVLIQIITLTACVKAPESTDLDGVVAANPASDQQSSTDDTQQPVVEVTADEQNSEIIASYSTNRSGK